jgi:acetoin utilization deacetylase AcuC-like enzyme
LNALVAGEDPVPVVELIKKQAGETRKTLLVTDERCHNCAKRQAQKDDQPENAERLMVLIDRQRGVLTQASEFVERSQAGYVVQREASPARLADVFRVHDYNYLMKVIEMSRKLELTADNKSLARFGKHPTLFN